MKNKVLWIGLLMLSFLLFFMFVVPYFPFVDQSLEPEMYRVDEQKNIFLPPFAPSFQNIIGTDKKGIDNFSKLVMGAKETILLVFFIALIRYVLAVPLGLLAYKQRGPAHVMITSLNQLFSSIPTIFSAILFMSLPFLLNAENRLLWVMILLAVIEVGRVAQIVQQQTWKISNEPFVEAGHVLGISSTGLYRRYYFPALFPEIIVNFCLDIGKILLLIGQLGILSIFITHQWVQLNYGVVSFLNTSNNWATLLASLRNDILYKNYSFIFYPALCITYSIFTFNVLGEGLRRHFNRHLSTR